MATVGVTEDRGDTAESLPGGGRGGETLQRQRAETPVSWMCDLRGLCYSVVSFLRQAGCMDEHDTMGSSTFRPSGWRTLSRPGLLPRLLSGTEDS